jgi:REP element-mobilizing transposase RayT
MMTQAKDKERFPVRRQIRLPREIYREEHVFFVTLNTYRRHPWFQVYPGLAESLVEIFRHTANERQSQMFSFCVMPDHAHLLVQGPDIVDLVRLIKGRAAGPARQYESGRSLWQRSFHDHGLRQQESVERIAQYIFENPVRSGLVESATDYQWSGSSVWPDWRTLYSPMDGRG